MNGSDILLLANTGTDESPVYEVVGSQRGATFTETTAAIDMSSKDSRNTRVIPGRYAATVTLEALYVPTDDAYLALRAAMRDGTAIKIRKSEDGVEVEEADAVVTSLSGEAPDQEGATISVDLAIDDSWTVVGS
jgi:TP901-1 family phage major tail protein